MSYKTSAKYGGRCLYLGDRVMTGVPDGQVMCLVGAIKDDEPVFWASFTAGVPAQLEFVPDVSQLTPSSWTFVPK